VFELQKYVYNFLVHIGPMPQRFDSARLVRASAILAFAAGVGGWGAVLTAPRSQALPPMLTASPPSGGDTSALARWFGKSAAPVKVTVLGLISAGTRGAAILAIDGGAPRAYRVGQRIADGVTLAKVEPAAVVLDQAGAVIRVAAPAAPALKTPGFVLVKP
jgi:general secretion pathway protein C